MKKRDFKAKFSNLVHRLLEPNIEVKRRDRWKQKTPKLTDAQKLEMFEKILQLHKDTSNEMTSFMYERRERKRLAAAREQRIEEKKAKGTYKPKVRMTKEQWKTKSLEVA